MLLIFVCTGMDRNDKPGWIPYQILISVAVVKRQRNNVNQVGNAIVAKGHSYLPL